MPTQEVSGTTALVTGASRGFGRVIAVALSKHGAHVAGAAPLTRPIHRQTWQTFSRNWEVDVQHVLNWTREALLLPLEPGSAVIAFSSGAAVNGSPLSGGYAGAKATVTTSTTRERERQCAN